MERFLLISLIVAVAFSRTGECCEIDEGYRRPYNDLNKGQKNIKNSPEECCEDCRNTDGCVAWVLTPKNQCWLKHTIGGKQADSGFYTGTMTLSTNVALGKPAYQSSINTRFMPAGAENAVDGNTNSKYSGQSCTHTLFTDDPWWKVDLLADYNVNRVVITNREDKCCKDRLVGAVVRVGSSENIESNSKCGDTVTSDQIAQSTALAFDCMEGTLGHIVSVQIEGQEGTLNLCEVEVYGTLAVVTQQQITTKESEPPSTQEPQVPLTQPPQPKTEPPVLACELPPGLHNVAQGKPAFQSSDKRRNRFGSENAVDGNFNTNAHKGSCSWTKKEYQPWWQVDLGDVHSIYEVVITNREDYCPFRLINAEIRVGTNENFLENPVCGMMITGKMIKENPIHVRCGCEIPLQGRYVSVQLIDKTQMLTLCEIEVMAA